MIGKTVKVKVDRSLGSSHPDYPEHIYLINYGYVEGIIAPDGEEQDVYILGVDKAVEEIEEAVRFQEKYFKSHIEMIQEETLAKKIMEAQARASKKWDEANKELKRYIVKRSTAKSFIATCEIEN